MQAKISGTYAILCAFFGAKNTSLRAPSTRQIDASTTIGVLGVVVFKARLGHELTGNRKADVMEAIYCIDMQAVLEKAKLSGKEAQAIYPRCLSLFLFAIHRFTHFITCSEIALPSWLGFRPNSQREQFEISTRHVRAWAWRFASNPSPMQT